MDAILRISLLFSVFAFVALAADVQSKSFSNGSQFIFDGSSSGYIITAGGYSGHGNGNYFTNVYALNLESGIFSELPPLPQGRNGFNLVLHDSTVYAVGGITKDGNTPTRTTLILSIKDNMWKTWSDLVFDYGPVLSASLNEYVYAVGMIENGNTLQAIGCNGQWNRLASSIYSQDERFSAIAVLNDKIYVLGSHHQDEVYDPSTDTWTAIKMTNQDRNGAGIVALNGYIFVIGGANGKNERYDPATGDLTYIEACLYTPVSSAGVVTDGKNIYVIGGVHHDGTYSNNVQVYRPDLDIWKSLNEYPQYLGYLGAVYVKDLPIN